jgi:hypothetical protein
VNRSRSLEMPQSYTSGNEVVRKYMGCLSYERILVGKLEGKRTFGRVRHRLEDNMKLDIQDIGLD